MRWKGLIRRGLSLGSKFMEDKELETRFQQFIKSPKGVGLLIVEGTAAGNATILALRPSRSLPLEEASVLGSFIKARLACDLPRAVAECLSFRLLRDHNTYRMIQQEGRTFEEPSWVIKIAFGQLGPLGFRIQWDGEQGFFYARLEPMMQSLGTRMEILERWQPIMEKVAEGYAHKIRTIEI